MTSGRSLTNRQRAAIVRLAGERRVDGGWLLSYVQIAERLDLNERTVRRVIRESAVRFGLLDGWKPERDRV